MNGYVVLVQDVASHGQQCAGAHLLIQQHEQLHCRRPAPRAPPPEACMCAAASRDALFTYGILAVQLQRSYAKRNPCSLIQPANGGLEAAGGVALSLV